MPTSSGQGGMRGPSNFDKCTILDFDKVKAETNLSSRENGRNDGGL